jgi:hypothetical protein
MKWFAYYSSSHENWLVSYESEAQAIEDINVREAERARLRLDPVDVTLIKGSEADLDLVDGKWLLKATSE